MSVPTLRLTQRPDHVVNKGDTILVGDSKTIKKVIRKLGEL